MPDYSVLDRVLDTSAIAYTRNEPLCGHTTFRIGGPADRFVTVKTEEELATVFRVLQETALPYVVFGNGSNLLVPDDGLRAVVLVLEGAFTAVERTGENTFLCGAGASLAAVCAAARDASLSGMEFAWGIPGSVGGAVYMNAGAYGGEMKQVLRTVHVLDETGTPGVLPAQALALSYRHSLFMESPKIITQVEIELCPGVQSEIQDKMRDLMDRRKTKQPLEYPSAGSVFKRPEGHFAGALVEQCGLKGYRIGGAAVSEKHAGFFVNLGNATCQDVEDLMAHVCRVVRQETGVQLEPEIRRLSL